MLDVVFDLYQDSLSNEKTAQGYAILGDYDFVTSSLMTNGEVLRGRKTNERIDIPDSALLAAVDIILHKLILLKCQYAERILRRENVVNLL